MIVPSMLISDIIIFNHNLNMLNFGLLAVVYFAHRQRRSAYARQKHKAKSMI